MPSAGTKKATSEVAKEQTRQAKGSYRFHPETSWHPILIDRLDMGQIL